MKDVEKQMQQTDLDKDGTIDWDEYKKATYGFMNDESSKSQYQFVKVVKCKISHECLRENVHILQTNKGILEKQRAP